MALLVQLLPRQKWALARYVWLFACRRHIELPRLRQEHSLAGFCLLLLLDPQGLDVHLSTLCACHFWPSCRG